MAEIHVYVYTGVILDIILTGFQMKDCVNNKHCSYEENFGWQLKICSYSAWSSAMGFVCK